VRQRIPRPSPALVVASLALLVALSGTSIAAVSQLVPRNSVGTAQLQRNAVTPRKIAPNAVRTAHVLNGSLLAADFKTGQIPAGPQGAQGPPGPAGPQGPAGAPATTLWAEVNEAGTLVSGSGATGATRTATGFYEVTFNRETQSCVPQVTQGADGLYYVPRPLAAAALTGNRVGVRVVTLAGAADNTGLYIAVFC